MKTLSDYQTIWLSDIHLGNKDCKAELLLDFLNKHNPSTLYLVGDIVDMWQMHRQFMWPKSHNDVLHKLIDMAHKGCEVIYLPGNHDEPLQKYSGMDFSGIKVRRETIHRSKSGERYLVLHGDQFDQEICLGKAHAWLGDKAYDLLLFVNRLYNKIQKARKKDYFSLAGYIKSRVKGAQNAINRYRLSAVKKAKDMGVDGVVCGHIHHPEITEVNGIKYINDGDWIENCSAVIEDQNGELRIVRWQQNFSLEVVKNTDRHTSGSSKIKAA